MAAYRTWVEIDERALVRNIDLLRGILRPEAKFCAVVKSNAYGHGLTEVARIAARAGVNAFAVDSVDEALTLRSMLPTAQILTLGYVMRDRIADAVTADIDLTVYDREVIQTIEIEAAGMAKIASIHLKLETGTARQGILADQLPDILYDLQRCSHLRVAGVSTHFANVEDTNDTRFANHQFSAFQEGVSVIRQAGFDPEWIHCACSAALILYPDTHGTLVRAGISMYGMWSSALTEQASRRHGVPLELEPVLSWKTRIAQVKSFPAGTPVGYGLTEVLKKNSRIAVLPVGYFDGYDRGLSSVGEVLVNGTPCRVVGRVCMNMMMVDVSNVAQVECEQEVVLIGRSGRFIVTADELASRAGTINYEIVSRINPSLPRIVV